MNKFKSINVILLALPFFTSCNVDFKKIEAKAALINNYEQVSLKLAKENRELHAEVKRLEFEVEKLRQDKSYYNTQLGGVNHRKESFHEEVTHQETKAAPNSREIASVAPSVVGEAKKDFVEFKTYKWRAEDMMKIADKEFKEKNYDKAAQFYTSIINNYPKFKSINDEFYFKAGIASYESGVHYDWSLDHFDSLMNQYPTSHYYRSAKLWKPLTYLQMGDKKKFFATVEEFRKKYRNTKEWKILSAYYEKIEEKTNE